MNLTTKQIINIGSLGEMSAGPLLTIKSYHKTLWGKIYNVISKTAKEIDQGQYLNKLWKLIIWKYFIYFHLTTTNPQP